MRILSDSGYLFMHIESADIDPSTPSFEIVIGEASEGWEPSDVSDVPKVCRCGKCAVDWRPLFVLETGLPLDDALQMVSIINTAVITNGKSDMWALVFAAGESPLTNLGLGGDLA